MSKGGWTLSKRFALQVIRIVVEFRYGPQAFHFWLWEYTPFPFGPPYWYQIHLGLRWAFRAPRSFKTLMKEHSEANG